MYNEKIDEALNLIKNAENIIRVVSKAYLSPFSGLLRVREETSRKFLLHNSLPAAYSYVDRAVDILFDVVKEQQLDSKYINNVLDSITSLLYFELLKKYIEANKLDEALKTIYEASKKIEKLKKYHAKQIKKYFEGKTEMSEDMKIFDIILSMHTLLEYAERKVRLLLSGVKSREGT